MEISPDSIILWQWRFIIINATLVFSWLVMALLVIISLLITKNLSTGEHISRWQSGLEMTVIFIKEQIRDITQSDPLPYLPFLGALLLFISVSNLLSPVPGYHPPTGSIYTTAALALCVFFAVPVFGITRLGIKGYLKHYIQPTVFMLPFNIIGEFSRTLALAVRLFGNVMSGTMIAAILLSVVPLFIPVLMHLLELLVGQIQAYIFTVLATVYIASASKTQTEDTEEEAVYQDEDENEI